VQSRVVSGGMVLKLEAAKRALEGGVREVRIVGGSLPEAVLSAERATENLAAEPVAGFTGTRVLREPLNSTKSAVTVA
jgi:glutamate 5-kinase